MEDYLYFIVKFNQWLNFNAINKQYRLSIENESMNMPDNTPDIANRLLHMKNNIIPQRLKEINYGKAAIELINKFGHHQKAHICVEQCNGSQTNVLSGNVGSIFDPVVSNAIIQCRCLLEFLGLRVSPPPVKKEREESDRVLEGVDNSSQPLLQAIPKRKSKADIGIEHYVDSENRSLEKLTTSSLAELLGKKDDFVVSVDKALATTYLVASQRLAHSTEDNRLKEGDFHPMFLLSFEWIPELVCNALYDRLGEKRPSVILDGVTQ